ncbi:hypothetical protein A4D02_13735 [Niastella koreensis]|uniref:Uncharacterized protein n=2 Tax=Niastella koreensis TaxID=354356 RepID=G8TQ12_NIAKG|nr:FISUMP domain-containing protein [Niastella koreensis]AEW01013.1 hypothetical protein Niako_4760 [Niastella koreensis GR20-10]OQP42621.1 hypothetical protein A4D02_13735 [Niastella koreensis]
MNFFSFCFGLSNRQDRLAFSILLKCFSIGGLILIVISSCNKKNDTPPPTVPTVTTTALTNITTSSATSGGTIVSDGNAKISQSGIVWSKVNKTPTLTDSVIAGTTSSGSFTINLGGLDFNTVYYLRAFATNIVGTGYGNVVMLNTTNDTTKVRFTYNGQEVVYGIIVSPTTGKKWLDRNLGGKRIATSFDDYQAYGDLFQWGRPADGHQLINWTSSAIGAAINGVTTVIATSDIPGHSNFITPPAATPYDWRNDNNSNRWATVSQGPCPSGWHVPTRSEWGAEVSSAATGGTASIGGITDYITAYNFLKLTASGRRRGYGSSAGQFHRTGISGIYWSSSILTGFYTTASQFQSFDTDVQIDGDDLSVGASVRCIKN